MSFLLTTVASIAALIAGYLHWTWLWLFLIAIGYFFPVCLTRYAQTMQLLQQQRIGFVTFSFLYMYLASLVGVLVMYGIGMGVNWIIQSLV